jgi:hypothetical protein
MAVKWFRMITNDEIVLFVLLGELIGLFVVTLEVPWAVFIMSVNFLQT